MLDGMALPTSVLASVPTSARALLRGVVSTAVDLILPLTCPGCHAPEPWCAACAGTLGGMPGSVAVPEAMLDRLSAAGSAVPGVHALAHYSGPVRAAIVAAKDRGRRDLSPVLGRALGAGLGSLQDAAVLPGEIWLVPAPSRTAATRARGRDPVLAMARAAAAWLAAAGRPTGVAPCLYLARGTRDSVGLDATARAVNMADAVRFRPGAAPPRATLLARGAGRSGRADRVGRADPAAGAVVVVDDVFTSGATACASVIALANAGLSVRQILVLAAVPPLRPRRLAR